jgi:hypothetical protein
MKGHVMFRKVIASIAVVIIAGIIVSAVMASTFSNTTPGGVDAGSITRTVNVSGVGIIGDVNVAVEFNNVDGGPCHLNPSYSLSNELSMSIEGPGGMKVNLINQSTYSASAPGVPNPVMVTFDDEAGSTASGVPVSGSFRPVQSLSAFDGQNADGIWTLTFTDNVGADDSCFYSLHITFNAPAVSQGSLCSDDRVNCRELDEQIVVYNRSSRTGDPVLHIYAVGNDSRGFFVCDVTAEDLPETLPSENILIEDCESGVTVYLLTTGEIQVNTTRMGNPAALVLNGLPATSDYVIAR